MQTKASRFTRYLCLLCLVLCLTVVAWSQNKDGRSFGGDYKVLQATDQGDNVRVRVSLRVVNNSGVDVQNATIRLASTLMTQPRVEAVDWVKDQLPFRHVTLHSNEHKIVPPLVGIFTIPSQEYEQWQLGVPNFVIYYRDASGERRHERIALAPAP
jgi:hypothetical protein